MIDKIALILAIIGGLNWGSIALFGLDLVAFLFGGQASVMSRIIYGLVGLAALCLIRTSHGLRIHSLVRTNFRSAIQNNPMPAL